MDVVVIRRPREDPSSKTGLGRYADSIEDSISESGYSCGIVEADLTLARGVSAMMRDGLIAPLKHVRAVCRDVPVVHATDELCGVFLPFVKGKRVLTVHHVVTGSEGRGRLYNMLWAAATRVAVRSADEIVAVSPNTAEDLRARFHPKAPVHVVYNRLAGKYLRDDSIPRERVVGVIAELIARKNVAESLEAFGILSSMEGMGDLRMRICGHGPEKDNLVEAVAAAGLADRVEFVDSLTDDEMFRFYNGMALLFNTSLHEGLGMVPLEANLCGTPSLCLERADIPEAATAASVKCRDARDMAEQAHALLTDPDLYARVSEASMETARRFGEGFAEAMMSVYGLRRLIRSTSRAACSRARGTP